MGWHNLARLSARIFREKSDPMRLTLRTLLAWRDGLLLEPEREELGAKVATSTVAPQLLERIADLASRTDLPAPRADNGVLADDANTVAEFLDNVLPADQLEAFERACLESEVHLAEAADSHSLLAEVMRNLAAAAPLDAATSARLIERIAQELPQPRDEPGRDESAAIGAFMREANAAAARVSPVNMKPRSRASLGAWLSAGVAITLLIVLTALLVRSIWQPAVRIRQVAVADQQTDASETHGPMPVVPPPVDMEEEAPPDPEDDEPVAAPDDEPIDDEPIDDEPGSTPDAGPLPPSNEPSAPFPRPSDEVVIPLPVMAVDDDEPPVVDPEPVAPMVLPQRDDAARIVAGGPLLHRVVAGNDAGWRAAFAGDSLGDAEEFIVPVHSYPHIVQGNVSIRVLPGTRAAVSSDRDGTLRLEIVFGRGVVWSEAADARVGITAGGLSGVYSLGPRQPVGIDVELTREHGTDPTVVPPGMQSTIVAPGGGRWRQTENDGGPPGLPLAGLAIEQPLPPRHGLVWDSVAPGGVRVVPMPQDIAWMKLTGPTQPLDRFAAVALASALEADLPTVQSLRALADSRRVEDRMAAAATLALLGDYDSLVEALCSDSRGQALREGEWRTLEKMAVPLALARGANAAAALRRSFERRGPPDRGAEIFLLARGLSVDELANGGAAGLVASLEDSALVVRRYSLANLVVLLPEPGEATRDYRPDRSSRLNDKGLAWWRARLATGQLGGPPDGEQEP